MWKPLLRERFKCMHAWGDWERIVHWNKRRKHTKLWLFTWKCAVPSHSRWWVISNGDKGKNEENTLTIIIWTTDVSLLVNCDGSLTFLMHTDKQVKLREDRWKMKLTVTSENSGWEMKSKKGDQGEMPILVGSCTVRLARPSSKPEHAREHTLLVWQLPSEKGELHYLKGSQSSK